MACDVCLNATAPIRHAFRVMSPDTHCVRRDADGAEREGERVPECGGLPLHSEDQARIYTQKTEPPLTGVRTGSWTGPPRKISPHPEYSRANSYSWACVRRDSDGAAREEERALECGGLSPR